MQVHRERDRDTGLFAIVQVFSHSRHRQQVVGVITLARVSNRLPWQNGHLSGRVAVSATCESNIGVFPNAEVHEVMALRRSQVIGLSDHKRDHQAHRKNGGHSDADRQKPFPRLTVAFCASGDPCCPACRLISRFGRHGLIAHRASCPNARPDSCSLVHRAATASPQQSSVERLRDLVHLGTASIARAQYLDLIQTKLIKRPSSAAGSWAWASSPSRQR